MRVIGAALGVLEPLNGGLLRLGRGLTAACVAVMVAAIMTQVFFRYVLNDALAWPEEVARALMIWMTAFAAPTAYRWGGFVAIDMLRDALPARARRALSLALLLLATAVVAQLFSLALDYYGRGFRSSMATVWMPDLSSPDGGWVKAPRVFVYAAMPLLFGLMLLVNIELVLRECGRALGGDAAFPDPPRPVLVREAE